MTSTFPPTVVSAVPPAPGAAEGRSATRAPESVRVLTADERPSVVSALRDVMERRDLLIQLAARDVKVRYKQAVMGFAWALLTPLLLVGAGTLLRVAMVSLAGAKLDTVEIGSVVIKAFPWAFFSGAVGFGVASVTSNLTLVTKIYFPRAVLPLAVVAASAVDLAIGAAAMLVVLPFFGAQLTAHLLWIPLLVTVLVGFTAGCAVLLACANLFFRDVKYITQVMLTFGVFFTPVLFDAAAFGPTGARLLMLNPLSPVLEGLRLAVLESHNLLEPLTTLTRAGMVTVWEPWYLLYAIGWATGLLSFSLVLFQRTQYLFAEYA